MPLTPRNKRSRSQAHAFEILAKGLPEMIKAREKSAKIQPGVPRQMGGITEKVAKHLGVEICTIFLLESDNKGARLVLAEAFGYDDNAIGKVKSLDKGITAIVAGLSNNTGGKEVICNFNVQDHEAWAGQLDNELPRHGWNLLGAPIIGADGKPKGVIKFENKKSASHSENTSTLLWKLARLKNTPGQILIDITELIKTINAATANPAEHTVRLGRFDAIASIARQLGESCGALSCDIPTGLGEERMEEELDPLDEVTQHAQMDELELQTAALNAALNAIKIDSALSSSAISEQVLNILRALEAFALALRAYTPFSRSDVYLVRAVAALIAAAMDISEGKVEASLHALQHGLRSGTNKFLRTVLDLTAAEDQWRSNETFRLNLGSLWLTALNISGPQDAIGASVEPTSSEAVTLGTFVERHLTSRLRYYSDCAQVWRKQFPSVEKVLEGWSRPWVQQSSFAAEIQFLLVGVCDILFCNAIEYGGQTIGVALSVRDGKASIVFSDDGPGIAAEALNVLEGREFGLSKRSRFGLKAANHVLAKFGSDLEIQENPHLTVPNSGTHLRIAIRFPINKPSPESTT